MYSTTCLQNVFKLHNMISLNAFKCIWKYLEVTVYKQIFGCMTCFWRYYFCVSFLSVYRHSFICAAAFG